MKYYNKTTKKWYKEGETLTLRISDSEFFSGIPTTQMLLSFGYEPVSEQNSEESIDDVKQAKIKEIYEYDESPQVNTFYVNNVNVWFDKETRSNFRGSLSDAELLGENEISIPINGEVMTLPIQTAKQILAQIQRYADNCAIVTATHIRNVNNLDSIEQVKSYDFTRNYPQKLSFNV